MKKQVKKLSLALGLVCAVMVASMPAKAALVSGIESINFDPNITDGRPDAYFGVNSSRTIGKHGWNLGFMADLAADPVEFATVIGVPLAEVTPWQLVLNVYASYGVTNWMDLGINIPLIYVDTLPIVTTGPSATFNPSDQAFALGDIRLESKIRLRSNEDRVIGLALVPFITLPTGDSATFSGNESLAGGAKVVLDFNIHDRIKLALNVGYLVRDNVTLLNADFDDQLLLSLGVNIKFFKRLFFVAEVATEPVVSEMFDYSNSEVENPFEVRAGFNIPITRGFTAKVGGGVGLSNGLGTPNWRAFLGLNYHWTPEPCGPCEVAPVVDGPTEIVISYDVHFNFDQATIKEDSYTILNDVAKLINANRSNIASVSIEGHTDSLGSDQYNQALSERRANAVRDYLVDQGGVPADMLTTVGYGESVPVDTNDTEAGRANNRRVEFKVQNK
ncbi:MAG: OmpA family protein [Deltaproteobacteria bacterium]|nr:OmpA family protein [Deltaproteobacteria bacterium]